MRTIVALALYVLALPIGEGSRATASRKIAVLEFERAVGLAVDRIFFSDKVRGAVQRLVPHLFVMTRESMQILLAVGGKSLADCAADCEVETGRSIGADLVISGRIAKIGTRIALTMRLHETASARLVGTAEVLGKSVDEIIDGTDAAVRRLLGHVDEFAPPNVATVERGTADGGSNSTESLRQAALAQPTLPTRLDRVTRTLQQMGFSSLQTEHDPDGTIATMYKWGPGAGLEKVIVNARGDDVLAVSFIFPSDWPDSRFHAGVTFSTLVELVARDWPSHERDAFLDETLQKVNHQQAVHEIHSGILFLASLVPPGECHLMMMMPDPH